MGKALTEELKKQISELYRTSGMSNFEIAKALDVSPRSVRRYKNYGYPEDQSNVQPESYDQTIDDRQEIEQSEQDYETEIQEELDKFEQENEITIEEERSKKRLYEYVEVLKCPQCDTPKSKWATIEQVLESGYEIPDGYERFYSYVCPKCKTLIPEKRLRVPGVCPGCGSTSIDWMPINDAYVSDEEKRNYDYICLNCNELIKVSNYE
jgi:transposase